jgi:hypothetical protein
MSQEFVALLTNADGCVCSDSQKLDAINHNLAEGFNLLINGMGMGTKQWTTAPSNFAILTANSDVIVYVGEKVFIQNLGTAPLFVKRGTGASAASFNYVLQAGGANDDGTGGALVINDFIGTVSIFGVGPRYNAWKP